MKKLSLIYLGPLLASICIPPMEAGASERILSALSDCADSTQRCEELLSEQWKNREDLSNDELVIVAEQYLELDAPPTSRDQRHRKQAIDIFQYLSQENPENGLYPSLEAAAVFDVEPIEGISLASKAVERFPNQEATHSMLAILLKSGKLDELVAKHHERAFALMVDAGVTVDVLTRADWAREAIEHVRGPGAGRRFSSQARDMLGWTEWSRNALENAEKNIIALGTNPEQVVEFIDQTCNASVVNMDEGELCERGISFLLETVPADDWKKEPLLSRARALSEYFSEVENRPTLSVASRKLNDLTSTLN